MFHRPFRSIGGLLEAAEAVNDGGADTAGGGSARDSLGSQEAARTPGGHPASAARDVLNGRAEVQRGAQ